MIMKKKNNLSLTLWMYAYLYNNDLYHTGSSLGFLQWWEQFGTLCVNRNCEHDFPVIPSPAHLTS